MNTERSFGCVLLCVALFIGASLGAIAGAFILSMLQYLYYVYFKPEILKDAQWGMVLLSTVFIGGWAGAFVGGITAVIMLNKRR